MPTVFPFDMILLTGQVTAALHHAVVTDHLDTLFTDVDLPKDHHGDYTGTIFITLAGTTKRIAITLHDAQTCKACGEELVETNSGIRHADPNADHLPDPWT